MANEAGLKQYYRQHSLELGFREAASRAERYNRVKRLDVHRQTKTAHLMKGLHAPSRFAKAEIATPRHWREQTIDKEASLPAEMQSHVELKHVAKDIIYTDGSRREFPDASFVTGGGVHRKSVHAPIHLTVRTNTAGENNTINRAEAASIYVALQECRPDHDEVIATDSKCSMDKIAKHMRDPALTVNDIHRPMLQAITELLVQRASNCVKTTLMKVKSHIGVRGNEQADQLANTAAELIAEGKPVDRDVAQSHCENFDNKFWPQAKKTADSDDQPCMQNVRNLDDALQNEIHTKLKLGQSNQDSIYFRSWQQIQSVTAAKYSNAFWDMPAITEPMKVNLLKSRCGRLWNKKLAFMFNMPYLNGEPVAKDTKCLLCGNPDSAGHILGHCQHKELKAHYIARHDMAMRKIIKEVMKGQSGSHFIIADVGQLEGLRQLGVHSKRIPEFVLHDRNLPQSYMAAQNRNVTSDNGPEQIRNKLKPDLMIVEMSAIEHEQHMQHATMAQLSPQMLDGKPRKVWVAEAGYCSDTMYEDKLKEKELQHKRLQEALSAYGYEVIVVPIILGFYGTIFTTTVQSAQTLGVERARVNRLMNTLHAHAITSLHTIVKLRRKLERSPTNRRRPFLQAKG